MVSPIFPKFGENIGGETIVPMVKSKLIVAL
jgi:hypothetical protein